MKLTTIVYTYSKRMELECIKMRKLKYRAENSPQAWFFLLPALIIIGVFSVFPLIRT